MQMGASVAHLVGKLFRRDWKDCRVLLGACAGAGFAAAFSAPIAGAVFVLEELVGHFETRIAVAALGASAAAIWLGSVIVGGSPVFHIEPLSPSRFGTAPCYLVLGVLMGLLGVVYNSTIKGAVVVGHRLAWLPVEVRAAIIGAGAGMLGGSCLDYSAAAKPSRSTRFRRRRCAGHNSVDIFIPPRVWCCFLRFRGPWWTARAHACSWVASGSVCWDDYLACLPPFGNPARSFRGRWDGCIFYSGRANTVDQHHPRHGNDGKLRGTC